MTADAIMQKVANVVRKALDDRFEDEFVFDPIVIVPKVDHDGDEYLHIYIVFDGDQKRLDPNWTLGLVDHILQKVTREELPHLPSKSFVEKSEWEEIYGNKYGEFARPA